MSDERYKDWFLQAENDLKWGYDTLKSNYYSQACFIAQQTAEKALKALAKFRDLDAIKSHSVRVIAQALGINSEIEEMAKKLDLYYIPTRYPDALPEGAPFEYYTQAQAKEALNFASKILDAAKKEINQK